MIVANKHNLQKTWMLIEQVINQNKHAKSAGEFVYNDKTTDDQPITAHAFTILCKYRTNIGIKNPSYMLSTQVWYASQKWPFNVCNTCLRTKNAKAHDATEWWCPW